MVLLKEKLWKSVNWWKPMKMKREQNTGEGNQNSTLLTIMKETNTAGIHIKGKNRRSKE